MRRKPEASSLYDALGFPMRSRSYRGSQSAFEPQGAPLRGRRKPSWLVAVTRRSEAARARAAALVSLATHQTWGREDALEIAAARRARAKVG